MGYLHCNLLRLRSSSSSSFPHVYLLLSPLSFDDFNPDEKAKQQKQQQKAHRQQQQQQQQQQQKQYLLLVAFKQSEHSTVYFYLPTDAVAAAAETYLAAADSNNCSSSSSTEAAAAAQHLLQLVQKTLLPNDFSFIASLSCNFWGPTSETPEGGINDASKWGSKTNSSSSSSKSSSSSSFLLQRLPHSEQQLLAKLSFSRNLSGDVPRKMKAELNREGGVYTLEPLPPRWDPTLNSFSLPFYGRARLPSAKNFQMVLNTSASAKQQQQQQQHEAAAAAAAAAAATA
ncbi:hypothetical protein, conserved [Eimeria acervulina]|uniref:Tubby C-terminal domain-containing protein n=1 Tax=Eimeria acervulina TaxID=5801 RepID=U6GFT8_EIMAC|nr:hypothetical protein, conserved [Eimeria acervulina]CDI77454.1 hypothetical protein, conserved [Eimeria acervulina]